MKPLQTAQQILVWFCLLFDDGVSISRKEKLARKSFALIFSAMCAGVVLLSAITFFKHARISVEEFFVVFYQFGINLNTICGFVTIFWFGKELSKIFESLSDICDKCKKIMIFQFFHVDKSFYLRFKSIFILLFSTSLLQ